MDARLSRVVLGSLVAVCLVLSVGTPAVANCSLSRSFNSQFQYIYWPTGAAGSGVFWALGHGDPAAGSGIDAGLYPVYYWGYLYVQGAWSSPSVDGCIDEAGASPSLDGDECMVIHVEDQLPGVGYSGLVSARAVPGNDPVFDFMQPDFYINVPPILRPTLVWAQPSNGQVSLGYRLAAALPTEQQLDEGCSAGVVEGYQLYSQVVSPGGDAPQEMEVTQGWLQETATTPLGQTAEFTMSCGATEDTFLSTRLFFDSGFSTTYVSQPATRIHTATDTDLDGTADACDPCTDTDGDGFGDLGFPSNTCIADNCVGSANPAQLDVDLDGVGDACDICPGAPDPGSRLVSSLGESTDQLLAEAAFADEGSVVYRARQASSAWELFRSPAGGGPAVKINPPLVHGGDVRIFRVMGEGGFVVYEADQDTDEVNELYLTLLAGNQNIRLNGPLVEGGEVKRSFQNRARFQSTPDSRTIFYLADQDTDDVIELYSTSIVGSPPVKLNGPLVPGGDVSLFAVSADGTTVVYEADQETNGKQELYSVPAGGGPAIKLNAPHATSVRFFAISPDSTRVVYDVFENDEGTLYSVPIGGGTVTPLIPPTHNGILRLAVNPSSSHVVYHADQRIEGDFELFSVPIDGGPIAGLNGGLVPDGDVDKFGFTPDGSKVVYLARQDFDDINELFVAPIAGGSSLKLNAPVLSGGDIDEFAVTSDGNTVVYQGDPDSSTVFELYSVSINGGAVTKLNPPLVAGGDVAIDFFPDGAGFQITPDGTTVIYRADQEVDELDELYSVPVSGGPSTKLSDPARMGSVTAYVVGRESERALFIARPGVHEATIVSGQDFDGDGLALSCDNCVDSDADGFGNAGFPGNLCAEDNCTHVSNPDQFDLDLDGAGDACDCAPADPGQRTPVDVAGLLLDKQPGGVVRLTWTPALGADGYSVTRGALQGVSVGQYGGCFDQVVGEIVDDPSPTQLGEAVVYLVQGTSSSCGVGPLGFTSSTGERINQDPAACH